MILSHTFKLMAGLIVPALAITISLSAQSEPESDSRRSFRIINISEEEMPEDLKYKVKGDEIEMFITSGRFSQQYPSPSSTLELYRMIPVPPNAPEGTEPIKQIMAQIPMSAAKEQIVFVAISNEGSVLPLKGLAVPSSKEKHPIGHARLINLSSHKGAIAIDGERLISPPRSIDAIIPFEAGTSDIIIAVDVQERGRWAELTGRKLRLHTGLKIYVVMHDATPTEEFPLPVRSRIIIDQPQRRAWVPPSQ